MHVWYSTVILQITYWTTHTVQSSFLSMQNTYRRTHKWKNTILVRDNLNIQTVTSRVTLSKPLET